MATIVLQFAPDGAARCLYTELLPLADLGRLTAQRASQVEFNVASQQWEVTIPDEAGPCFSDASRQKCLDWEQEHLNQRLLSE